MPTETCRKIVLALRPEGQVRLDNFRLEDMLLPEMGTGQVLLKTNYLSLDPYMRGRMDDVKSYAPPVALDAVMEGEGVATVIASNSPKFAEGDVVTARTGWQTHAAVDADKVQKVETFGAPVTTALGVLGMPGFTAYSGMREIGKPAPGETVVVAAASGPVGSLVGQLAKAAGARTVGIAGGSRKCGALKETFGFDVALDHRSENFESELAAACPDGIDVYFENVGGKVLAAAFPLLNKFARIPVCGLISFYSDRSGNFPISTPVLMRAVLTKSLTIRGYINYDLLSHHRAFLRDVSQGIRDGSIRYTEDIVEGLQAAPEAFIGLLAGRNFGKLLIHVG